MRILQRKEKGFEMNYEGVVGEELIQDGYLGDRDC